MYLCWFDDSKKPIATKIAEARAAYRAKFQSAPNVVLISAADLCEVAGVVTRAESYIRPSNFWVGFEDAYKTH